MPAVQTTKWQRQQGEITAILEQKNATTEAFEGLRMQEGKEHQLYITVPLEAGLKLLEQVLLQHSKVREIGRLAVQKIAPGDSSCR